VSFAHGGRAAYKDGLVGPYPPLGVATRILASVVERKESVPRVVITHAVVDVDRWLEGKNVRAEAIESGSGSNVTDYVARDGSNNIAITADVSDPTAMQAMLAAPSAEVAAAMEQHGVVPPISAYIEA
jgi:hypothetical protein